MDKGLLLLFPDKSFSNRTLVTISFVNIVVSLTMSPQEANSQRIADSLCAGVNVKRIAETGNVSLSTVTISRKVRGIEMEQGTGGANNKRDSDLVMAHKTKVSRDSTTPLRKVDVDIKIDA